jgi:signal transduction histidine kinase
MLVVARGLRGRGAERGKIDRERSAGAQRIVERHAGTLEIGAVDGGGTRVTVHLPLS